MGATTIVDVITGADAAVTVAVDAATAVDAEPVFLAAVPPAAAFSGSSFLCVAAEITDMAIAAVDAETVTIAGSLSYCFCCAEIMAADVDADDHCLPAEGIFPLPFYISPGNGPAVFLFRMHCLTTLFFLFHTLQIYLIKSISIHNKLFFLFF